MKLSEQLARLSANDRSPDTTECEIAKQLESDSQMLEDLIEIMMHHVRLELSNDVVTHQMVWCHISHNIGEKGVTPREAIFNAIKEWKKICLT